MGSDWEDFCESNGWNPGSEDDYDKFLDSLENSPQPQKPSRNEQRYPSFASFDEAVKWAKANPGGVIKRAPDGHGFETKNVPPKQHFIATRGNVGRHDQRLPDRESAIWSYQDRSAEIAQLTPHLHDVLSNSASNSSRVFMRPFNRSTWDEEQCRLSRDQLRRLRLLVAVHLEASQQRLQSIYSETKKNRRMKPGHYGEALDEMLHTFMKGALVDIDKHLDG